MGVAQSSIARLGGAVGVLANVAAKQFKEKDKGIDTKDSGIDAKMAAKARRTAQQKISAIAANKEISAKARSRRIGQAIDEYKKTIGGEK